MKSLITILLLSLFLFAQAQNDETKLRASKGILTLNECENIHSSDTDIDIFPSLHNLLETYAHANDFEADSFYAVVDVLTKKYVSVGEFSKARQVCDNAIKTYKEHGFADNCKYTREIWLFRGQLEVFLNDFDSGLYYLRYTKILCDAAHDRGLTYMILLMNMALAYDGKSDVQSAKMYMEKAISVFENLNGSIFSIHEEEQFAVLSNYGQILFRAKDFDKAEQCFRYVVEHCQNTPASAQAFSLAANYLADLYINRGDWNKCISFLEGLDYKNKERDFFYCQNLLISYLSLKKYPEAIQTVHNINNLAVNNITNSIQRLTRSELDSYWSKFSLQLLLLNNFAAIEANTSEAVSASYDNILFCRNLLVDFSEFIERAVHNSGNQELVNALNQYKAKRERLSFKSSSIGKTDSLFWNVADQEIDIIRSIPNLKDSLTNAVTWKNVRRSLSSAEAAIEFTLVPVRTGNSLTESEIHYGAFVVTKDCLKPQLVLLGRTDSIDPYYFSTKQDALSVSRTYSTENMKTIYSLLWQKIEPLLKGFNTVYYSPVGFLANLNFDMLCDEKGRRLADKYKLVRVSSSANISNVKVRSSKPYRSAALFGNISYDVLPYNMISASRKYVAFSGENVTEKLALRSENERGEWGPIPATKREVDNISALMKRKNLPFSVFEGQDANEEAFKALTGKAPDIIHLATHAFNISSVKKAASNKFFRTTRVYSQKERTLLWTGLLLAGSNNVWTGKHIPENVEDGILTADEISRLDLSNSNLVVMSACSSGQGEIDLTDGIIGLQRAFKKAGAGTILMTLWNVHDDATQLLISSFYKYLLNGAETHSALHKAVNDTRKQYTDPYYWAGFVLLD